MHPIVIAIDGPSSSGKSTLARQLAAALNYRYIDSGGFYRAITLYLHDVGIDLRNREILMQMLKPVTLDTEYNSQSKSWQIMLNGRNVESEIRGIEISGLVSGVSAIPEIRSFVVSKLRQYGVNKAIVMDGRDIGTVVFPDAELKIYMTADERVRGERRYQEMKKKGWDVTATQIAENLAGRDLLDTTRETAPLKRAEDAVILDNTALTEKQQFEFAMELATRKISNS